MALVKGTNSYATVAEANTYFADRINATVWSTKNDTIKAQALVTATSILDEMPWAGTAISEDQPLAFPRSLEYFDPKLGTITAIENIVPNRVINACLELANHLVMNDGILDDTGTVTSLSVGSINLNSIKKANIIPLNIKKLFKPLLVNSGSNTWWRAN